MKYPAVKVSAPGTSAYIHDDTTSGTAPLNTYLPSAQSSRQDTPAATVDACTFRSTGMIHHFLVIAKITLAMEMSSSTPEITRAMIARACAACATAAACSAAFSA